MLRCVGGVAGAGCCSTSLWRAGASRTTVTAAMRGPHTTRQPATSSTEGKHLNSTRFTCSILWFVWKQCRQLGRMYKRQTPLLLVSDGCCFSWSRSCTEAGSRRCCRRFRTQKRLARQWHSSKSLREKLCRHLNDLTRHSPLIAAWTTRRSNVPRYETRPNVWPLTWPDLEVFDSPT